MKCTHQVSDKGSNIIWTSTDTGGSKDVPDGRRRPEAHAFERFGIICTCNKSRHIKKNISTPSLTPAWEDNRFIIILSIRPSIAKFYTRNSFYSLKRYSSTQYMLLITIWRFAYYFPQFSSSTCNWDFLGISM